MNNDAKKLKIENIRNILRQSFSHACGHCFEPTNNIVLDERRKIICCSVECANAEVV